MCAWGCWAGASDQHFGLAPQGQCMAGCVIAGEADFLEANVGAVDGGGWGKARLGQADPEARYRIDGFVNAGAPGLSLMTEGQGDGQPDNAAGLFQNLDEAPPDRREGRIGLRIYDPAKPIKRIGRLAERPAPGDDRVAGINQQQVLIRFFDEQPQRLKRLGILPQIRRRMASILCGRGTSRPLSQRLTWL